MSSVILRYQFQSVMASKKTFRISTDEVEEATEELMRMTLAKLVAKTLSELDTLVADRIVLWSHYYKVITRKQNAYGEEPDGKVSLCLDPKFPSSFLPPPLPPLRKKPPPPLPPPKLEPFLSLVPSKLDPSPPPGYPLLFMSYVDSCGRQPFIDVRELEGSHLLPENRRGP
jgi:hypothetical protein